MDRYEKSAEWLIKRGDAIISERKRKAAIIRRPMILAGGIWEALITTAAGLTVAIPSLIIYRFLTYTADKSVAELEFLLEKFVVLKIRSNDREK